MENHPLERIFTLALQQATNGKGSERHGKNVTDFTEQPWVSLAKVHGTGFLTGQAQKKIMEAVANKKEADYLWYEKEILGAINYLAMALIYDKELD